jgi:hypothetical protein
MSFILDALKKSDKKRQESAAPRLDTVHDPVPPRPARRPVWWSLFGVVVVVNLAWMLWFFSAEHQDAGPVTGQQGNPQPEIPGQPVKPNQTLHATPTQQTAVVRPQQTVTAEVLIDDTRQLLRLSELPLAVQRTIPQLHMSLHAFNKADPAAGMVRVNEQILRQGDKLAGKYLLEEITAEGAVFRAQGYRFLLPRN